MPYAKNGDINIYYEVEGEGLPLMMLHGFQGSLVDYREAGYVDALKDEYQLILVDLRGHGKSDKPHDPQFYTVDQMNSDLIVVLDDLEVPKSNLLGYSAGGIWCQTLARSAGERVNSLILLDTVPKAYEDTLLMIRQVLESGFEAYAAMIEQIKPPSEEFKARLLANDLKALAADSNSPKGDADITGDLPNMRMPFLVLIGENDIAVPPQVARELYSGVQDITFIVLPGLDHVTAFFSSDVMLPHIKEFLARVSKGI